MIIDNSGLQKLIAELRTLADKKTTSLIVASSLTGAMRARIHTEGKDSSGGQIGTYSPGYMTVRTGQYKNSKTSKKGVTKSGKFTKGSEAKTNRPNYNRGSDTKVILSLTRQQENDLGIVENGDTYGIGYKNELNAKKAEWEEATYKKKIFDLTSDEQRLADEIINKYISDVFA